MILKIDQERHINTDHIICIFPAGENKPDTFTLLLSDSARMEISGAVLDYIMDSVEANVTYTELTAEQVPKRSLNSRVATLLQNHANGLTYPEIMTLLGKDMTIDEEELDTTLDALVKENVISAKRDGAPGFAWHWYHNANSTRKVEW